MAKASKAGRTKTRLAAVVGLDHAALLTPLPFSSRFAVPEPILPAPGVPLHSSSSPPVLRVVLIPIDPESTDINHYIGDGRVQGAGINPYLHIPTDLALHFLRDDAIYPEINRKYYARTIYRPLARVVFYLTTRVSEQIWAMKSVMIASDPLTIWALLRLMKARNLPPTRMILYAWHPVSIRGSASRFAL